MAAAANLPCGACFSPPYRQAIFAVWFGKPSATSSLKINSYHPIILLQDIVRLLLNSERGDCEAEAQSPK
jgi:hypothetical protein